MRIVATLLVALGFGSGCKGTECNSSLDCPPGYYCFGHCRPLFDAGGSGIVDGPILPDGTPPVDAPPPDVLTAIDVANIDVNEQAGVAVLELTEMNPNLTTGDLIKLRVLRAGNINGITVLQNPAGGSGSATLATLPSLMVAEGDLILIHEPPAAITTETTSKLDCSPAAGCSNAAWDIMGSTSATYSDRVIAVRAPNGTTLQDAVAFTNASQQAQFGTNVQFIQTAGMWHPTDCAGAPCTQVTAEAIAADWSSLSTTTSVHRVFSNRQASDWIKGNSTFDQ